MDLFLFWDKNKDELEILDEHGEFWFYSEDTVEIDQTQGEHGRYWTRLEKLMDSTPLNIDAKRFEILDVETGEWLEWEDAPEALIQQVQKLAGVMDWQNVF